MLIMCGGGAIHVNPMRRHCARQRRGREAIHAEFDLAGNPAD